MSLKTNNDKILEFIYKTEECNKLAQGFVDVGYVFEDVKISLPQSNNSELFFIRTVSWLYVHYFEAGKIAINFLQTLFTSFSLTLEENIAIHPSVVNALRTELHHNLRYERQRDRRLISQCRNWFNSSCSTSNPKSEEDWSKALEVLLSEALIYIEILVICIRRIERDELCDNILRQWVLRINRYHPPHEFDEMISEVANDIGRSHIDPIRIRKRFYQDWIQYFDNLKDGYDFKTEARRLIEFSLIEKGPQVLPITGNDIMKKFNLEPGAKIGILLNKAKEHCKDKNFGPDELLQILKTDLLDLNY